MYVWRTLPDFFFLGSACTNDKCVETCDEGWEKHDNHCYHWVAEKMNWTRAEDFCQKEEGHLASVSSNETMDFVTAGSASRGLKNVWLGGSDIEEEGVWKWTDCTPWELTFWPPGEPSNSGGQEHCLHLGVNRNWNDAPCGITKSYVTGFLCSKKICSNKGLVYFNYQIKSP